MGIFMKSNPDFNPFEYPETKEHKDELPLPRKQKKEDDKHVEDAITLILGYLFSGGKPNV